MEVTTFRPLFEIGDSAARGEESFKKEVLNDYYVCCVSREASILARKEVLTGKAKFGITGDGKEVAQVALAKAIAKGDHRSGYYRDQTLMFALGAASVEDYFSQLYADALNDPFSHGRQMMSHFASEMVDTDGRWTRHTDQFNNSSDVSCTAGQMGRAMGLALASRKYRHCTELRNTDLSRAGDEVVICSIGDGSTSEGSFWESVNAATVMQVPIAFCVWDDGYAISVPTKYQTVKGSISEALSGFLRDENGQGMRIYTAKAWDYPSLCDMFIRGINKMRKSHVPALFHVKEATQPLGHSTSGSHERYKPKERIQWEKDMDCIEAFTRWIIFAGIEQAEVLADIRNQAREYARSCKNNAWQRYAHQGRSYQTELVQILQGYQGDAVCQEITEKVKKLIHPIRADLLAFARQAKFHIGVEQLIHNQSLRNWIIELEQSMDELYGTHLYTEGPGSALEVPVIAPTYEDDAPTLNGYEVLNRYFKQAFKDNERLFAFGEDVGHLGDVNQGMMGMQAEFGKERVFDAGIREWTIVGQAIGMAMRGLRPIAEIQYLDYLIYAMAPLVDDLASLSYRTRGMQKAPAIIRTRGHRLEGIWHTGSPMGMLLSSLRGMHVLVPRNMVQAAGMYQTLLTASDPALMIECLNGYRQKETLPANIGTYTVPLGVPEVLREGSDLTVVTYGACVRLSIIAADRLAEQGIDIELIDVQTLIPFDRHKVILRSLQKTNRILFVDEDVPGGATAYMMQQVIEEHGGFDYCEIVPRTLTAKSHRTPYGSDGDYYAKPNAEDIFESCYQIMHELEPINYGFS